MNVKKAVPAHAHSLSRAWRWGATLCARAAVFCAAGLAVTPVQARAGERPVESLLERRQRGVVMQKYDLSCGAAALATLLGERHGERVTEREVATGLMQRREYVENPRLVQQREGFSLLDLKRYVTSRGYVGLGYGNLTWEDLQGLAPVMVPVNIVGYNHFVVFEGSRDGDVLLADPAWGQREMSRGAFLAAWIQYPGVGRVGFLAERAKTDGAATPGSGSEPSAASTAPGQAAAAPGTFEVDEAAAERALERSLTQNGALLLGWGLAELQLGIGYARTEEAAATLVLADGQAGVGTIQSRRNDYVASAAVRFGLPLDSQLELTLPYRGFFQSQVEPVGFRGTGDFKTEHSGFDDLSIGLAKTLYAGGGAVPDVISRIVWNTGSGDSSLGRGFQRMSAGLTLLERQDPLVFIGNIYYEAAFSREGQLPGDQWGLSVAALLAASPRTSLSVGLEQILVSRSQVGGVDVLGSDIVSGTLLLGATSVINRYSLLSVAGGVGLTKGAADYSLTIAVPVRLSLFD
jgi:predicted double-glycine peptidase